MSAEIDEVEEEDAQKDKSKKKKKKKEKETEKEKEVKISPFQYSSSLFAFPLAKYCGNKDFITCQGKILSIIRRSNSSSSLFSILSLLSEHHKNQFDDIGTVGVSPCGRYIAAGSTATWDASMSDKVDYLANVVILSSVTYELICSLPSIFLGGVISIAFSVDAKFMAVLCGDIEHTVCVLNSVSGTWTDCEFLLKVSTSISEVTLLSFCSGPELPESNSNKVSPRKRSPEIINENNIPSNTCSIAVAGVGGLFFIEID